MLGVSALADYLRASMRDGLALTGRFLNHQRNVVRDAGKVVLRKLLPQKLYWKVYQALRRKD